MEKEITIEQIEAILGKLPEIEAGYEWEYMGLISPQIGDFFFCVGDWKEISECPLLTRCPTMRKVKVDSPTKITDLVGEDWQKLLWLTDSEGNVASAAVAMIDGEIGVKRNLHKSYDRISRLIEINVRWAHRGDTPYEDANEFVL